LTIKASAWISKDNYALTPQILDQWLIGGMHTRRKWVARGQLTEFGLGFQATQK